MSEVINVFVDVPIQTHDAVVRNEDGSYSVFINPALDSFAQRKAYLHAMYHIEHDFNGGNVQEIESTAHHNAPIKGSI